MSCITELITISEIKRWKNILSRCIDYDTYHLPEYHLLAQANGEGNPFLFYFQQNDHHIAIPFLRRDLSQVQGFESVNCYDSVSVYGYAGVVSSLSQNSRYAKKIGSAFQEQFFQCLQDMQIICFFSRQNPLFPTSWLINNIGDIAIQGNTVAIDLRLSEEEYNKMTNENHRRNIKRGMKYGIEVFEDSKLSHFNTFISMYNETMKRNNAQDYYFFSEKYYSNLLNQLSEHIHLFVAKIDKIPVSTALIFATKGILQYHLSGTPTEYLKYSPLRNLLDGVRQWGKNNGYAWFHLGGGLGARDDSLFRFKAGFSRLRLPFEMIKVIVNSEMYNEIKEKHENWLTNNNLKRTDENFFPIYRAPFTIR